MKHKMIGREVSEERLNDIIEENNLSGAIEKKPPVENKPTMQNGYNDDMTIRVEEIKKFVIDEIDKENT